jgi:hypothetical protein
MLVVAQVALSLALVVAAGLFVHTFASLATRNPGFDPEPLVVVRANVARSQVPREGRLELFERLREGAAATPGVASATASVDTAVTRSGRERSRTSGWRASGSRATRRCPG